MPSLLVSVKHPLVSIIIPNYNGSHYIVNCLNSVFGSFYSDFEVIFVDNASTDDSLLIVNSFKKVAKNHQLTIIPNSSNLGFAQGNNIGIAYARGEYLVFLNNDTVVEPTWLQEMVTAMVLDQEIGAAQSKLLILNDRERIFDSAGDFMDFYGTVLRRGGGEKDLGQYETRTEVFSARGACMIVRQSVLKEVGGFDPSFVLGFEDVDLCWRIRLRGYKIVYVPRSIVFHKGYGTPSHLRNVRQEPLPLLMIKNYDAFNLLLYLSPYLVFTLISFILDILLRRNLFLALNRFNELRWVMLNLRSILTKRQIVQGLVRRVPDKTVKKMMLQSNLGLYTRFVLEERHAIHNPMLKEKLLNRYFLKTDPHGFNLK